jgi:hypothetical protein
MDVEKLANALDVEHADLMQQFHNACAAKDEYKIFKFDVAQEVIGSIASAVRKCQD